MTEFVPRELPAPKYKLVDTKEDDERSEWHVKLAQPHIARLLDPKASAKSRFVEVEYVHVTAVRKFVEDASGAFTYNETTVTASDEEGTKHNAYLFFAHRKLDLSEALFSIGEV